MAPGPKRRKSDKVVIIAKEEELRDRELARRRKKQGTSGTAGTPRTEKISG
jgi:hypothetical protein